MVGIGTPHFSSADDLIVAITDLERLVLFVFYPSQVRKGREKKSQLHNKEDGLKKGENFLYHFICVNWHTK